MFKVGKYFVLLGATMTMLSACVTNPLCGSDNNEVRLFRTPSEFMVNQGIKNYEDGNYAGALNVFQNLVSNKKSSRNEKIVAYKYMAFIHCISPGENKDTREKLCRDSFRKAFELNPSFDLSPAEAGHPVWGPVFSSVKNTLKK